MPALDIRGVMPPMLTPFKQNGDIDFDAHVRNLARWNKDDLGGYLVLGSNGETPYLTETEKLQLIELTVQHAAKGRTIIAGTGLESTRETIRLTNVAAGVGAHVALVLTPSFFGAQMTDAALVRHYHAVADAARIPILLYSVPVYTHLSISVNAVRELSRHANIIGMKDSSGDVPRFGALKEVVPEKFNLIVGSSSAWYPALSLGACAGILALANFCGNQCALVQQFFDGGRDNEARLLHQRLVPVNTAVTSIHGIAGLKYAATLLGYDGGFVRSPLIPLSEDGEQHVRRVLIEVGLL